MNEDFVFTKEEKVNKLFKVLNVLKNSLQCKRMVVGGSMAMYVHGFNVEPHDLDIEIEADKWRSSACSKYDGKDKQGHEKRHPFRICRNIPSISYKNRRCGCRHMGGKQNRLQQDCFLQ